jgi:outer membrane protein OmpA-like peptidoglycan-associated protein
LALHRFNSRPILVKGSEDDIYNALEAPPVEPLERTYTLDEVCASVRLRERMRSVNIDTIHFEFGSWEIGPDQANRLESVAAIMKDIVSQNPREVFLIEGHTDAVGSAVDNLSLSDRRAEAVANILSQQFGVPAENLVTRGYGKQFPLIGTDGPEWRNRRVVVRRITPLLSTEDARAGVDYYGSHNRYRR